MNTNPGGNTIITDAQEAPNGSGGEFERFEALLSGLVQPPRRAADQPASDAHRDQRPVTSA